MKAWLNHSLHSLCTALDRLARAPLASLFTILVMGVSLSLPAGLYLILANLQRAAGLIHTDTEMSLFLKPEVTAEEARKLAAQLGQRPGLARVRFVHRDEALQQLEAAGLQGVAAGLPDNPLPHTLVLVPRATETVALESLATELRKLPQVEGINLDTDWVRRLAALMDLGRDVVLMLAVLLGLALAAITGNTIRLQIYAQRDEIEVARLIGATDRFIRRPFLYFGALQGLAGGIAAWLLLGLATLRLQESVARLAASYGSQYAIHGLTWQEGALLIAVSTVLGLAGAYFAVGYTLRSLRIP